MTAASRPGHTATIGAAVGLALLENDDEVTEDTLAADFQVNVAGAHVSAELSTQPFYDPDARRMRD